ncbi:glycosyltransferase family 2 protein [Mycoplasmatota bacterium]|nr:glycosyltransferase family 2 protein [Mycoplasmatota bacterium]
MKNITIITPTFNRSHILLNVYKSLAHQTVKDFKWLIIDDGSTDNTKELISSLRDQFFEIKYLYKNNGGKASALNLAFDHVDTKYFTILDSDDYFASNAIEIASKELSSLDDEYIGIINLRHDKNNIVLGKKEIPKDVKKLKRVDIENKFNINSEVIAFYKSAVLQRGLRFPLIDGEKFISPAFLEFEVTKDKYFKVVHEIFCYCEYLDDGLTKNKKKIIIQNPRGYTLVKRQSYTYSSNFSNIIKNGIMYIAGSILSKNKKYIKESPRKILTILLTPFGILAYLIKFRK